MCVVNNSHIPKRITQKQYVPSTRFERATLGANSVPNMLYIVFLFSDYDVVVQGFKVMGLIPSNVVCCEYRSQKSWCVDTGVKTVTNGDVGRPLRSGAQMNPFESTW